MLNPSDHSPEQLDNSHPLKQLIQKHPFLFWGGLWTSLIFVGSFAALGLLTPGPMEQDTPKPTPAPAAVQISTPREDLSLSLFAAIAIGCASGSFLFVYILKNSARSHQASRRLNSPATITKKRRQVKKRPVAKVRQTATTTAISPLASEQKRSQITVLSPEESHPLDQGDDSLANLLDLRKRQSLDSLMGRR
ncbi:MAG: hypothetical protein WBG73_21295 [Coleofasciculaceae cyanobacterium]